MTGVWGRDELEWNELVSGTAEFLGQRARLKRTTTYTELNYVLARRVGGLPFDFDTDRDRAAMGALLGEVSTAHLGEIGAMLSALVIYLNENDAGSGFYALAVELGLLPAGATREAKTKFWIDQVNTVHAHFSGSARAKDAHRLQRVRRP